MSLSENLKKADVKTYRQRSVLHKLGVDNV